MVISCNFNLKSIKTKNFKIIHLDSVNSLKILLIDKKIFIEVNYKGKSEKFLFKDFPDIPDSFFLEEYSPFIIDSNKLKNIVTKDSFLFVSIPDWNYRHNIIKFKINNTFIKPFNFENNKIETFKIVKQ